MSKHISASVFLELPSGSKIHPCRLIQKDGSLMWKHALEYKGQLNLPRSQAQEAHIVKTAQRLEELNSWVSQSLEPWITFAPHAWYIPDHPELGQGISLYFQHTEFDIDFTYERLKPHVQDHERLEVRNNYLYFKRC
tara:strand:- start:57 stop:467 length:411 start_codon:yes stop_codon:yes gene_type:complete